MSPEAEDLTPAKFTTVISTLSQQAVLWERDWPGTVYRQLLVQALLEVPEGLDTEAIATRIQGTLRRIPDQLRLQRVLRHLEQAGIVIRDGNDYTLTDSARQRVRDESQAGRDRESDLQDQFGRAVRHHCPNLRPDDLWEKFDSLFFEPAIESLGANAVDFVFGELADVERCVFLKDFLATVDEVHRVGMQAAVVEFLNPDDEHVRRTVSERLTRRYLIEAAGLAPARVDHLRWLLGQNPTWDLFVDSNLGLAFLGLQDDAANQAAAALLTLAAELADTVEIAFHVLPLTVKEMGAAMRKAQYELTDVGDGTGRRLSTLARRCREAMGRPGGPASPADWFQPRIRTLIDDLRQRGVELYDFDVRRLRQDPLYQVELEAWQRRRKTGRAGADDGGRHEKDDHDVLIRLVALELRPSSRSVVEARFWVLTLDHELRQYDNLRTDAEEVAACLHPSTAIPLFGLWAPRSEALGKALLNAFRRPYIETLAMHPIKTSTAIRDAITAYEQRDDLSRTAIAQEAAHRATAARLRHEPPPPEDELDPDADRLEALARENERLQAEVTTLQRQYIELEASTTQKVEELDGQLSFLLQALKAARSRGSIRRFYRRTVPLWVGGTLAGAVGLAAFVNWWLGPDPVALLLGTAAVWAYVTLFLLQQKALADPDVSTHRRWRSIWLDRALGGLEFAVRQLAGIVFKRESTPRDREPKDPGTP